MIRTFRQRFLIALPATLAAALCGILAGLVIGGVFAIKSTESQLDQHAREMIRQTDAMRVESQAMLSEVNASKYPFCSEAEVTYFRLLIFHSASMRDTGHMIDGRIACSATLGRENLPTTKFEAITTQEDGASYFNHMFPYQAAGERVYSKQMGNAFVVLDPRVLERLDTITENSSFTLIDPVTHRAMQPGRQLPVSKGVIADANWQGRVGDWLLVTHCSTRYPSCMTTYANIGEVLRGTRSLFVGYALLGELTGVLFGLACLLIYRRSRNMARQLRQAIRQDKLWVVYQPIVNLTSRRIVGAEALARWTRDGGVAVSPDVFVKVAEERGFVGEITKLVVRHAVRDFREMFRDRPEFHLSINVTAADLSDSGFLPMIEGALQRAEVRAQSLVFEVTERSTVRQGAAIETIGQLRQRGFGVHIDDFGTGYSSLSYLHALSINAIKIDKSFTQAIGTEAVTAGILPQILAMAEALKLQVIVEGVENELQADYFSAPSQPVFAQGWFFGRPVPADQFHVLLAEEEKMAAVPAD
jgi:sensor c-di-GMP phosphodiesterase-like protein